MKLSLLSFFLLIAISNYQANAQWTQLTAAGQVFTPYGNNIFTGGWGGVFVSTNNGESWANLNLNVNNGPVTCIVVNNNNIYAGTANSGLFLTANNGSNWTTINNGLYNPAIRSVAINGNNIFIGIEQGGTYPGGIYRSANGGASWSQVFASNNVLNMLSVNNNVYAGCSSGVTLSTDNGTSWSSLLNGYGISNLDQSGNNFVATPSGFHVFYSTNSGSNWTDVDNGVIGDIIMGAAISGNNLFAGTFHENGLIIKIYFSGNGGTSWQNITGNIFGGDLFFVNVFNNYVFVGTAAGLWRRPLNEITGIEPNGNNIPDKFSLAQNYPNPFNPSTKISYSLPKSEIVSLTIYDDLGKEVKTLVNEMQNPGAYNIVFDASNLPSGVYYYKLTAGDYSETKKMVLMK